VRRGGGLGIRRRLPLAGAPDGDENHRQEASAPHPRSYNINYRCEQPPGWRPSSPLSSHACSVETHNVGSPGAGMGSPGLTGAGETTAGAGSGNGSLVAPRPAAAAPRRRAGGAAPAAAVPQADSAGRGGRWRDDAAAVPGRCRRGSSSPAWGAATTQQGDDRRGAPRTTLVQIVTAPARQQPARPNSSGPVNSTVSEGSPRHVCSRQPRRSDDVRQTAVFIGGSTQRPHAGTSTPPARVLGMGRGGRGHRVRADHGRRALGRPRR
jgi:hypothetical protein